MKLRHKAALTVSIILSAWNENCAVHTGIFLCIYLFNCWKICVFFIKTPTNTQTTATTTKQSHQFGYSYRIWSSCLPSNPETLDLIWGSNWKCFPLMSKKSPHMHYYNCLCLLHMVLYWFPDIEKIRWKSITFASSNQVMIHLYGISWFKMLLWEICCHNRKFSI